jgi:hypothetical protein
MKVIAMAKMISLRIDDTLYEKIKRAAESEHRSVSNYIENATRTHLVEQYLVADEGMKDILKNKSFVDNVRSLLEDIRKGKYSFVD